MYYDPKLETGGAYLLTWKPDFVSGDLKSMVQKFERGTLGICRWSTGGTKWMQPGAPFFFLLQGLVDPGIIGWGRIRSQVRQDKHWDSARRKVGILSNYVDVEFSFLTKHNSDEAISRKALLEDQRTKDGQWNTQSSGTRLKAKVAEGVRQLFNDRCVKIPTLDALPDVKQRSTEYFLEGAAKLVQMTRHERSTAARVACIEHYGCVCQACNFDFGLFYGPEADGMIEVHHLRPISQERKTSRVNPTRDLVPLCANCHRVAHMHGRNEEPISIKRLQAMVKRSKSNMHEASR